MTRRQQELLAYISGYLTAHDGVAPSLDEMTAALGLASKSGISRLLWALEGQDKIRRTHNRARSIEVIINKKMHMVGPEMSARLDEYCLATGEPPAAIITAAFLDYFACHPVPK